MTADTVIALMNSLVGAPGVYIARGRVYISITLAIIAWFLFHVSYRIQSYSQVGPLGDTPEENPEKLVTHSTVSLYL